MKQKLLFAMALLLPLIVGEVQAQKSLPSKHGFEQNRKSANARETFGQNRNYANAREVQSATTAQTPSRRSVLRAPSTDALAPTDVAASGITPTSATVSWNGTGDSYNLRYRKMIIEGFESCSHGELPAGWTALDADGDGHSWFAWDYSKEPYDYYDNPQSFNGKSVDSESYLGGIGALTPDNWLISPQVPLKGELSLWVRAQDPDYVAEHFAIYLSTTGKDVADFTTVLIPETVAQGVLTEYTADLSTYAGQVGYIAIRHFNCTDMFRLGVDNITIIDDWVEADGVTSPYTLDGLDDLSIYEVEVQAVTGEQQSSWSTLRFNTSGFPPTNATILYQQNFDDTNDINELGWTFVDNDGNGLNWTMSINGKFDNAEVSPLETSTSFPNSLYSLSFTDDGFKGINADNWAITPAIEIYESSILSFQLAYANVNYPDKVGVYVGETANVNEMTEVLAPTSFTRTAKRQFNEETVDLSAFAGKTCYIAFRHQENNKSVVFIDDVTVYTTATKYDLTLADGTEDAANWQGKAGEGEYQALPLKGVAAGTAVSVKYSGTKKVKSVKAVKKAAPAPARTLADAETTYAAAEETAYTEGVELTKNPDGTWTLAATPAFDVELEVEYYEQVEGVVANQDPDKTSDYWCTYYNPTTNVKVSTAGVSIYKAALSGETLALSKVDGNVIKGGQAVVLKSTVGGELDMVETSDAATGDYTGNELKGTTEAINGNGKIYVLNCTQENGVGFYQLSTTGTLGANKAYLEYNGSNARAFFSFGFDDETSGIENTSSTDDTNRGEVYDLQGRQVKQPARGLYIKSGKKVVIK